MASSNDVPLPVSIDDVRTAARRIRGHAFRTPILTDRRLDERVGAALYFKCENLQRGGAFKMRGALNAVLGLDDDSARHGVATHSSGNHGNALSIAAGVRGVPAYIVVPSNATRSKRDAIAANGGQLIDCEPTLAAREDTLQAVVERTGAHVVHPYDDPRIIAGQGTAALELLEDVDDLDQIWVPIGGGGLASGTAVACTAVSPPTEVIAAEPAAADDAYRSLRAGHIIPQTDPRTIADGLRTSVGKANFAVLDGLGVSVALVSEAAIVDAMRCIWQHLRVIVEPSGAVPLAALIENPDMRRGERIGVILSGGNVDLDAMFELMRRPPAA